MRISLFGIGYVGAVSAACLARDGHRVLAVDTQADKVEALNRGVAPMVEPGLDALIQAGVASGRLSATTSAAEAVAASEVSIVCVGTPSAPDGSLDLQAVERVAVAIGGALRAKGGFHAVVIRSTLTPGATVNTVQPLLEQASGRKAGTGFGLAYYPELLREGAAIADYDDPSLSILAVTDAFTRSRVEALQPRAAAPPTLVSFEEAEAIKMGTNVWRAFKVGFANEIGGILGARGVDSHRVIAAVCSDTRLNLSPAYLMPGFAFGGSCLPKDARAFAALAQGCGRGAPVLDAVLRSNDGLIDYAAGRVAAAGGRRVGLIGLAFKPGGDDLRESPYLLLASRLIAEGYDLRWFDPDVRLERMAGANLAYAMAQCPTLADRACRTLDEAVDHGETLVLAHRVLGAAALDLAGEEQRILDLVRVRPDLRTGGHYQGLAW